MTAVDKARVGKAFTRGAAVYDEHAAVQRHAIERSLELLPRELAPRRVLDVGAGTGLLLARLAARLPDASLTGVDLAHGMASTARGRCHRAALAQGDAEALPFRAGAFDLVLSTSTFQWLPSLGRAFGEAARVLRPGGVLAVALFGGATLFELRAAWRDALPSGAADRTHDFHRTEDVAAAVRGAGLELEELLSDRIVERHPDPLSLLRSLKRIGAGNASGSDGLGGFGPAGPGLSARGTLHAMARLYAARHGGGGGGEGVPATWEIVYAVARKRPA